MPIGPNRSRRAASRVARRAAVARLIRVAGFAVFAGSAAGLALIGAGKLAGWDFHPLLALGAPVALGLVAAGAWAWRTRLSRMDAAQQIDQSHGWRDRVSNALLLDPAHSDFAAWALEEGETAAGQSRAAKAAPIRVGWTWPAGMASGAAAIALALWVPAITWNTPTPRADPAEVASAAEAISSVARTLEPGDQTSPLAPLATAEDRARLDEIERELASGGASPDEARAKAAEVARDLAARAEREAEQIERSQQALADALREAAPGPEADPDVQRLANALADRDWARAEAASEAIEERLAKATPEERSRLARSLEQLADSIPSAPEGSPPEADAPKPPEADPNPQPEPPRAEADQPATDPGAKTGETTPSEPAAAQGDNQGTQEPPSQPPQDQNSLPQTPQPLNAQPSGEQPRSERSQSKGTQSEGSQGEKTQGAPSQQQGGDPNPQAPTREELARENREKGMSEEQAQQAAERELDARRDARAREDAKQKTERLREAMREAAERSSDGTAPEQSPPNNPSPQDQTSQNPRPTEQPGSTQDGAPKPTEQNQSGQDSSEQSAPQRGEQPPQPQPDGGRPGETNQEGSPRQGSTPQPQPEPGKAPQQGEQPGPSKNETPQSQGTPGQNPQGQNPQGTTPRGEAPTGDKGPGTEPRPAPDSPSSERPSEQPQPGSQPDSQRGEGASPRNGDDTAQDPPTAPDEGPTSSESESGSPRDGGERAPGQLRREIQRLRDEDRRAADRRRQQREAEGAARELMSEDEGGNFQPMPPSELPPGEGDGRPLGPRAGSSIEDVESRAQGPEVRPDDPDGARGRERVLAEWESDRAGERTGSSSPTLIEGVRQAAEGAERAIEQRGVPSRYGDFLRRVYRRLEQRTESPMGEGER